MVRFASVRKRSGTGVDLALFRNPGFSQPAGRFEAGQLLDVEQEDPDLP